MLPQDVIVTFKDRSMRCLVDSGADISIVTPLEIEKKKYRGKCTSISGGRIKITGIYDLWFKSKNIPRFQVSMKESKDLGGYDMIIGRNILQKIKPVQVAANSLQEMLQNHFENAVISEIDQKVDTLSEIESEESEDNILEADTDKINMFEENKLEELIDGITSPEITETQLTELKSLLKEYKEIFLIDEIPTTIKSDTKHKVVLEKEQSLKFNPHRVSPAMKEVIKDHVTKLLDTGLIRKSNSSYGAPVILQKKKSGEWRFCIDYRELNKITVKDAYPIPIIEDIFDSFSGLKYFSTLDMASGYWQIPLEEESKKYTAFTCFLGTFEWKVMPFGLTNAPATFQRFMDEMIYEFSLENFSRCLMDDILIYSKISFDDHLKQLKLTFEALRKKGCKLKFKKCKFIPKETDYLGALLSKEGIRPSKSKVEAIEKITILRNVKQVRSFLGLAGYYRKFVPNFARIAVPLQELLQNGKPFVFDEKCVNAMNKIKHYLSSDPLLVFPDFSKEIILRTDASKEGLGACLIQVQDGNEKVISYNSRSLKPAEKNYPITGLEALAIVFGAKKNRSYLYGNEKAIIETDHKSLEYIKEWKDENGTVARWWMKLQDILEFATIRYKKGSDNIVADTLSRIFTVEEELSRDKIIQSQNEDSYMTKIIDYKINNKDPKELGNKAQREWNNLIVEEGILYYYSGNSERKKIVIPRSMIIPTIIAFHEKNHLGINKTLEMMRERVYWFNMISDISRWISSCEICQKYKISRLEICKEKATQRSGFPWKRLHLDFIGPLKMTNNGYKYILLVTDHFTKYALAFGTKKIDALETAQLMMKEVCLRYGCPIEVKSDQGTHFDNKLMNAIWETLHVTQRFSIAYNQRANGIVERLNATLVDMLATLVNESMNNWDELLPIQ